MFRKRKVTETVHVNPPRELTGIEKHELDVYQAKCREAAEWGAERERKICDQISEIERKIAPELAQLSRLRAELNPYAQYQNAFHTQLQSSIGFIDIFSPDKIFGAW